MTLADKLKEKFESIKKIMLQVDEPAATPTPEPAKVETKMEEYVLADNSVLSIDKLEVGGNVLMGEVAAADGTYNLPNGDVITVAGGMISEIKKAEPVAPVVEETEMQKQVVAMSSHIKALETKQAAIDVLATKFEAQEKKIEALNAANKELLVTIELMANESKVTPIEKAKSFDEMTNFEL
jgi:hypothetical protein